MFARSDDGELPLRVDRPAQCGNRDAFPARQVGAGDRFRIGQQVGIAAAVHDVATVFTGPGPDVDNPVGARDGVLVVFDHDQGVAEVPQSDQRFDQPAVVALMKSDRGLVKDVEHPDETGADLGCQPDALRLTARQRGRRPRQRQVVEADVE